MLKIYSVLNTKMMAGFHCMHHCVQILHESDSEVAMSEAYHTNL